MGGQFDLVAETGSRGRLCQSGAPIAPSPSPPGGPSLSELIRYRYNTKADETPGGEWKWRVIFERGEQYEEVLVKQLLVNVPSFSRDDIMPVVGPKYHIACYGVFRLENGVGIIDAE
jgi:hypothetical protein